MDNKTKQPTQLEQPKQPKQPKQLPPHVIRTFRFEEKAQDGALERHITVNYEYDRPTKTLKYGASVFRPKVPQDVFTKKGHRETAEARRIKCPVVLEEFDDGASINDLHFKIREMIHPNPDERPRVKGPRVKV